MMLKIVHKPVDLDGLGFESFQSIVLILTVNIYIKLNEMIYVRMVARNGTNLTEVQAKARSRHV